MTPATLPPAPECDCVHLWLFELDQPERGVDVLLASLADDERRRASRFHRDTDRRDYVVARGMLRRILARYLCQEPGSLRFGYGEAGKPFLAASPDLAFNLSHSGGWALIATAAGRVGVDLEAVRPMADAHDLARANFAPGEVAALAALPPAQYAAAFFACWTCKEAYVKAVGTGFSMPLDAFEVSVVPGQAALLSVGGSVAGARGFSLIGFQPRPGFWGALAVELAAPATAPVLVRGQLPVAAWL
jgi:4'-phosphopantetheinyl transferase